MKSNKNTQIMKTYTITYNGKNERFANFFEQVDASNSTEALLIALNDRIDLFEQEDGSVKDSDGEIVLTPNYPHLLDFDGGYFIAE